MLETICQDARYAVRSLRRAPTFTVAAVLTLALGIGLTTAVYSVVDAVLVEPIPFADDDHLVVVWETDRDTGTVREPGSFPDFLDFRERSRRLERLAGFIASDVELSPDGGDPTRLASLSVTGDFFSLFGISAIAGRVLTAEDDRPGAPDVVVLSEQLWDARFHRDPAIVGTTLRLNGRPYTVAGVAPQHTGFGIPQMLAAAAYARGFAARDRSAQVEAWVPLRATPETLPRDTHPMLMVGRMRSAGDRAAVQEELAGIAADLERAYPSNEARGVFVEGFGDVVIGPVRPALLVLLAAVVFLLLISCVNVANLLLARATLRLREIAVRSAVGASTQHLARQFIVESAVLTSAAAVVGVWLAFASLRVLLAIAPAGVPRLATIALDLRVLLATSSVCVGVAMVFGLLPLTGVRRIDLQSTLRSDEGRTSIGGRQARTRRAALVAVQVALAVALVTAAGLLLRTVGALRQVNPGFDPTGVVKAEFQLPPNRYPVDFRHYPNFPEMQRFNERLLTRIAALPGVEAVGLAGNQPLDAGFTNSFVIVGREAEAANWPEISIRRVTGGYFSAMKVRLATGRFLDDRDAATAPPVALINEAAAERFFPAQDPIGHQMAFWGANRRIVGVVGSEKIHGMATAAPIAVYTPLAQTPSFDGSEALLVRAATHVEASLRAAIKDVDPALAVFGIEPLNETVSNSIREQQFLMQLLSVFAAIALAFAAIGIHGVLAYALAQRTREIGVRVALGAGTQDVMRLVLGQSARMTAIGLSAGVVIGVALASWLRTWLYGVTPTDPVTLVGVVIVLGAVAGMSSYFPTRRAIRIDPVAALRGE